MNKNLNENKSKSTNKSPTFKQLVISILGAALGVQSAKTQERDFQQASPKVFIIGGIIFGIVFVLVLVLLVKIILSQVTS